jgi:hypothetical protein
MTTGYFLLVAISTMFAFAAFVRGDRDTDAMVLAGIAAFFGFAAMFSTWAAS